MIKMNIQIWNTGSQNEDHIVATGEEYLVLVA